MQVADAITTPQGLTYGEIVEYRGTLTDWHGHYVVDSQCECERCLYALSINPKTPVRYNLVDPHTRRLVLCCAGHLSLTPIAELAGENREQFEQWVRNRAKLLDGIAVAMHGTGQTWIAATDREVPGQLHQLVEAADEVMCALYGGVHAVRESNHPAIPSWLRHLSIAHRCYLDATDQGTAPGDRDFGYALEMLETGDARLNMAVAEHYRTLVDEHDCWHSGPCHPMHALLRQGGAK